MAYLMLWTFFEFHFHVHMVDGCPLNRYLDVFTYLPKSVENRETFRCLVQIPMMALTTMVLCTTSLKGTAIDK